MGWQRELSTELLLTTLMDATAGALALLDCLERDDIAGIKACTQTLRREGIVLRQDGLELIERAVALERLEALRELLHLGSNERQPFDLFGRYHYDFLVQLASNCLESGRIRILLELLTLGAILPPLNHDYALVDRIAKAAVDEFELHDNSVVALARTCKTNQGAFLVQALRAGRVPLVQALASICTSNQTYGASRLGEAPLIAAAQAGAIWALRDLVAAGAKPSVGLRNYGYALHFALHCEQLPPSERAELVHELLRVGAVPELRDCEGMDAYKLAESLGDRPSLQVLREHGLAYGPRQSREARARHVRDLCFFYDKADGLIYRIGQPDVPFLVGGDYDGPCPCSVEEFRLERERVAKRREFSLAWFEPFLQRLEKGQEFGYKELISKAPHFRIVHFDETTNWSQMVD